MTQPTLNCIHHMAFRCKDAEETTEFYRDRLGLKLKVALIQSATPGTDDGREFMHLFFEMDDENFIAFFDDPSGVEDFDFKPMNGLDCHLAFSARSMGEMDAWMERLKEKDVPFAGPIDHGFVHSIYFWDPNGVALEITYKDEKYDEILTHEEEISRRQIKDWTAKKAVLANQAAE
jgi:catechol 2,3-dioxygenase-like lactoylglutathione lyase family enzyme